MKKDDETMRDKAKRVANLRKIKDDLIATYADEKDPGLRLSLFDILASLAKREKMIFDEVE